MASLVEIAQSHYSGNPITKPLRYYEIYERALTEEDLHPQSILEIGVYEGESVKVLATRFPSAHIVALDLNLRDIDFSGYANVSYLQCDQTDAARIRSILQHHFPNGVDLVIDDASHIGHLSRLTFDCIFPHLRSGGLYIVEDWGTGYMKTWVDGHRFAPRKANSGAAIIPRTMPSHDFGMVGFVKSLVDYTAIDDITDARAGGAGWAMGLVLFAGRFRPLIKIADHFPRIKAWLVNKLNNPQAKPVLPPENLQPALPRLKSLKFHRGVCIACKA